VAASLTPVQIKDNIGRIVNGLDKIKNSVLILLKPTSSQFDKIVAWENIGQGAITLGQGIDELRRTPIPGSIGVFGATLNQFNLGGQIGKLLTAVQNGDNDAIVSNGLGVGSAVCSVLSIIPPLAVQARATGLVFTAAKDLWDNKEDIYGLFTNFFGSKQDVFISPILIRDQSQNITSLRLSPDGSVLNEAQIKVVGNTQIDSI
jgi:hypothetical protein